MDSCSEQFMVAIECMTYNQKSYIIDALNGFVIQNTSFPYVIILVDDASTDGEADVIDLFIHKKFDIGNNPNSYTRQDCFAIYTYAHYNDNPLCSIIYVRLKNNLNKFPKKKRSLFSKWESIAKYIAICEGDDFWTDSQKLQKQVDFLENNCEFSICYHPVKVFDELSHKYVADSVVDNNSSDSTILDLAKGNYIHTLSVMYRNCMTVQSNMSFGITRVSDYLYHMLYAEQGKIHRIDEVMGVYRQGVGVWTNNSNVFIQSIDWIIATSKLYSILSNEDAKCILDNQIQDYKKEVIEFYDECRNQVKKARYSKSYRLGYFILHPFSFFKRLK